MPVLRAAPARAAAPVAEAAPEPAEPGHERYSRLGSIGDVAAQIAARAPSTGAGYRTLLVDGSPVAGAGERAAQLAATLAGEGRKCLLVDWSPAGGGAAEALGLAAAPGMSELIQGEASFEDVIQRMPRGSIHFIAAGQPREAAAPVEADRMNLILDALDEAYDHIIVTGDPAATRELFVTIQGRFDAGVLVGGDGQRHAPTEAGPGTFLGFDVTDIDVIRLDEGAVTSGASQGRKLRLARGIGGVAAPAGA